ncbi:MAG: ISNCY family transposase [Anaerolineae bacterium]
MAEDRLMSVKEADRWYVIRRVISGEIRQKAAAELLRLSTRQVRRLEKRVRERKHHGVVHGLRGRASNRRLAEAQREEIAAVITARYHDFGPTLAQEKLVEHEGIDVSVSTVRRVMIARGLWQPGRGRTRHRAWRERKRHVGELIQVDGSEHAWFEERGPRCHLMVFVDDATGRIMLASFEAHEDTGTLMRLMKAYLGQYGRPLGLYPDRDSIYRTSRQATIEEELRDQQPETQFARAMRELDIELRCAGSPQAKGRVERLFETLQDRMVKEMRLAGIATAAQGNAWLPGYLESYNRQFAVPAAEDADLHRRVQRQQNLDAILAIRSVRTVTNDYTVRYQQRVFQLHKRQPVRVAPKVRIEVEERLDGTTHLRYHEKYLNVTNISDKVHASRARTRSPTRAQAALQPTGTTGHFY